MKITVKKQITDLIKGIFPLVKITNEEINEISKLAIHDKKNKDGIINAVLLNAIGDPIIDVPISSEEIISSLEFYNHQIR